MIRNQAVWSGKADAANKQRVLRLKPFCQASGFSVVVWQGKIGRCSANFQFRQRHGVSHSKRFLEEHVEKPWFR